MKAYIEQAITSLVMGDETIERERAFAALAILRGEVSPCPVAVESILTPREAARWLHVSIRRVRELGRDGRLKGVTTASSRGFMGFSRRSVETLAAQGVTEEE